jgi:hypothetical protein
LAPTIRDATDVVFDSTADRNEGKLLAAVDKMAAFFRKDLREKLFEFMKLDLNTFFYAIKVIVFLIRDRFFAICLNYHSNRSTRIIE